MTDCTLEVCTETLALLPERAVYWPRTETLLIADLHLGKAATYRAYAIPLPEGNVAADLERLSAALLRTNARQLIILGDLLHSARGRDPLVMAEFTEWRAAHAELDIHLVLGNHDLRAGEPPLEWKIRVATGPTPGPCFVLNHEPLTPVHGYALTGHLHPAVRLTGRGKQALKLPCFWFGKQYAVLPAFGSFTGGQLIEPTTGDRVYAVTETQVLPIQKW